MKKEGSYQNMKKGVSILLITAVLTGTFCFGYAANETETPEITSPATASSAPAESTQEPPDTGLDLQKGALLQFPEIKGKPYETAVLRVSALGLMEGYEDGSFGPDKNVTRAEFMAILIRASNLESVVGMQMNEPFFADVAKTHWAHGYIALAAKLGFVNGTGGGNFDPESYVTYEQAVKGFVNILGYGVMNKPQPGNAWYTGYMATAAQIGLLKGLQAVTVGQPLSRAQVAVMLDNAIQIDIMTEHEGDGYAVEKDVTLLYKLLDNGASLKGVVEANSRTALTGSVSLQDDTVIIDGYSYLAGETAAADYLGRYVQFFVKEIDGEQVIMGIFPVKNRNETLELNGRDVVKAERGKLTYESEETGYDSETADLSETLSVIYNGTAYPGYPDELLESPAARLELVDNSGDGIFDVVFVQESNVAKVQRVNTYDSMLYLQSSLDSGKNNIDFKAKKSEITLKSSDGTELSLEDISEEDTILEICASYDAKVVNIIRLDNEIVAAPESIDWANNTVTIEGTEYELYANRTGALVEADSLEVGTEYCFTLDSENRIVDADKDTLSGNLKYGLIYRLNMKQGGIQSNLEVKLVSGTAVEQVKENDKYYIKSKNQQNIAQMKFADRVRVEEIGFDTVTVKNAADLANRLTEGEVVQYSVNKDGEINRIIKSEPIGIKGNRNLVAKEMVMGGITNGAFGLDEDTVVFFLPEGEEEEDFRSEMKYADGTYECLGYDLAEDEPMAGAVVFQTDIDSGKEIFFNEDVPFAIVQAVTVGIDENGQEIRRITGYENGKQFDLTTSGNAPQANEALEDASCGSLIRMGKNFEGKIITAQVVKTGYNASKPEYLTPDSRFYDRKEGQGGRQLFGMVTSTEYMTLGDLSTAFENVIYVSVNADGTEAERIQIAYNEQDAPDYYIYDYARRRVLPADFKDIIGSDSTGSDSASRVLVYMINSVVKAVVIVK